MQRIVSSADLLVEQAVATTHGYFHRAVQEIDASLGDGFSEKHPELIAAFMRTAALDFATAVIASVIQDLTEVVERRQD